jgi:signal transduction histidine kinase
VLTRYAAEVPVILAVHTSERNSRGLFPELMGVLRAHLRRRREAPPEPDEALVRALCHDMAGSLAGLDAALGQLDGGTSRGDLLAFARAQAAHLTSMLRTADATGGSAAVRAAGARPMCDVVAASVAASGLPRAQLSVSVTGPAADVAVADARVQRILVNLLESAHRHGGGAAVRLEVSRSEGWVSLAVTQEGLTAHRVVGHLFTERPPADLTGLGLWSVRRRAHELGGEVRWSDGGGALTLTVLLPDL